MPDSHSLLSSFMHVYSVQCTLGHVDSLGYLHHLRGENAWQCIAPYYNWLSPSSQYHSLTSGVWRVNGDVKPHLNCDIPGQVTNGPGLLTAHHLVVHLISTHWANPIHLYSHSSHNIFHSQSSNNVTHSHSSHNVSHRHSSYKRHESDDGSWIIAQLST